MGRYFKLNDDVSIPGRWELDSPTNERGEEMEPWQFIEGMPLDIGGRMSCRLLRPGRPLDFSEAPPGIPVVGQRVVELLQRLGVEEVQFFPVRVGSQEELYFVLNATRLVDCIDEARCMRTERWKPEDGRPERVGEYRVVERMRIDPGKVGGARVFRTWGWPVLVVAAEVKQTMEREGLKGPRFIEV
jgi:hypothetical protein